MGHIAAELEASIDQLPHHSGVYLMYNLRDQVIYVGKAKDLKKRVSSYFLPGRDRKTTELVKHIHRIDYTLTPTAYDALLLENNLIKQYNPKYNIQLKDSKSYPFIRISNEPYPRILLTRHVVQDGSTYLGPYPSVRLAKATLEAVDMLHPLCKKSERPLKEPKPCFYYHIGKCPGVCAGAITHEAYMEELAIVRKLLRNPESLIHQLGLAMKEAAAALKFEKAGQIRDALQVLQELGDRDAGAAQIQDAHGSDRDYLVAIQEDELFIVSLLKMREGRMQAKQVYTHKSYGELEDDLLLFAMQYYEGGDDIPPSLYVELEEENLVLLEEYLRVEKDRVVRVLHPRRGRHVHILAMACENAQQALSQERRYRVQLPALEALQELIGMDKLPARIEGYDIAHLAGKYTIASMVSFWQGRPQKSAYRRFRIRGLDGAIDDFQSMAEATLRRYSRLLEDDLPLPDLILIDGGLGQVHSAEAVIKGLGIDIPIVGLAKAFEEIVFPDDRGIVRLPDGHEALKLLQAVRDESHRFATSLNQNIRSKEGARFSLLEAIPGVGPKRAKLLMEHFLLEELEEASAELIAERCAIPLRVAREIVDYLR